MNNGSVTTKRNLTPDKVRAVMETINEHFGGKFTIHQADDAPWLGVFQKGERTDGVPLLGITITSRRRLETRKGGGGDFMGWIETLFQEGIAAHFNGRCGSEGVGERWDPRPDKFMTFRAYYNHLHSWGGGTEEQKAYFFDAACQGIPKDFQSLIG